MIIKVQRYGKYCINAKSGQDDKLPQFGGRRGDRRRVRRAGVKKRVCGRGLRDDRKSG